MWSLGVLIGIPVLIVTLTVCAIVIVYNLTHQGGYLASRTPAGVAAVIALFALVTAASPLGLYPYNSEYHQWIRHTGVVTQVNSRILGEGNSVSQKFVVVINGQELGCNDTRCSLIKPGDTVTLSCKRVWQYASVDGYDCNFVSRKAA